MDSVQSAGSLAWAYRSTLVVFFVPALASPLLVVGTGPAKGGWVVIVMASYWITEALPLAVTALLPMILYPLLGIMETNDVTRTYFRDTVVLFLGSMIMANTVEERNLHKRIAIGTLLLVGSKPQWLMLGFMISTAFLSMWIKNTATTAMMVPIAHAIVRQIITERKMRAAGLTADTEMEAVVPKSEENDANGSLEVGCVKYANYQDTESDPDLQPRTTADTEDPEGTEPEVVATRDDINPDDLDLDTLTPEELSLSKGMLLCIAYAATIGGSTTLTGTGSTFVMAGLITDISGGKTIITFANWFLFMFPVTVISIFVCWIWLQTLFLDNGCCSWFRNCRCCRSRLSPDSEAARDLIKREYKALGSFSFAEVAVIVHFVILVLLWFFRKFSFIPGFDGWSQLFVAGYVNDATAAMVISISLFICPSKMPWFLRRILVNSDESGSPGPVEPLLSWKTAQQKMPWNVVFLIGGGFALAEGCEESGLSDWLAELFAHLSSVPPWCVVLILTGTLCLFTEFTSNVATTTIFLPICASMAESLCVNPVYLMIPVTLACTYAYMLPAATPPNAIVFSFGTVQIPDMVKAGISLNIFGIAVANILINTMGDVIYDVFTYPSWAPRDSCPT